MVAQAWDSLGSTPDTIALTWQGNGIAVEVPWRCHGNNYSLGSGNDFLKCFHVGEVSKTIASAFLRQSNTFLEFQVLRQASKAPASAFLSGKRTLQIFDELGVVSGAAAADVWFLQNKNTCYVYKLRNMCSVGKKG